MKPVPPTPTPPLTRKPWLVPTVAALPKLTDLTLQTGGGIPGECDIGSWTSCF